MRDLSLFFLANFFLLQSSDLPDGFIYLNDIENTIVVDLKYYSQSNFTGGISALIPLKVSGISNSPCLLRSIKIDLIFSRYVSKIFIYNYYIG